MKKVMAFGVFDGFHKGHEFFLKSCSMHGKLTVVVARDSTVIKTKSKKTVNGERSRLSTISRLPYVEKAVLGDSKDFYKAIRSFRPDIICLGYDQKAFTEGLNDKLAESGLDAKIVRMPPFKEHVYKSSIINRK